MTLQGGMSPGEIQAGEAEREPGHFIFPEMSGLGSDEVLQKEFTLAEPEFSGTGREMSVQGIHYWYQSFAFHQKRTWRIENNAPRVLMNFNLQGRTAFYSEALGKVFVRFKPGQHNLMLIPEGPMRMQWAAGEQSEIFSLSLSTDFFFDMLPAAHPLKKHFEKGVHYKLPAFMSLRNLPVTPRMTQVLFEMLQCDYSGLHKTLFIKAKTMELLILQMEQYEQFPAPDFSSALTSEHTDQMHLAKRMLDENLDRNWSLKDLAHRVGTNEFNLKKYFKEVFGKTVFGYLHEVRMETSKEELCKPGALINEVAQRMGYKHPTHFTAAFKKYHGMLPTRLRVAAMG